METILKEDKESEKKVFMLFIFWEKQKSLIKDIGFTEEDILTRYMII